MKYEPHLIKGPEELNFFWPYIESLVVKYVDKTNASEITPKDVFDKIANQQAFCFIFAADNTGHDPDIDVKLVLVLEVIQYPRLNAMNIVLLAGEDLLFFGDSFWEFLKGWAYMNGIRAIEALVKSEALERMISKLGFKRQAVFLRADIGD